LQRHFNTYSLNTVKKAPRLVGDYEILFANDDNDDEESVVMIMIM